MLLDKQVLLNYEEVKSSSINLNDGDILSIRKYGKYKFIGIIKERRTFMELNYILEQLENIKNELLSKESEIKHQREMIERAIKLLRGK